jgi:NADP-dependent 3-hydroxy acid dehydrogenase YdfG
VALVTGASSGIGAATAAALAAQGAAVALAARRKDRLDALAASIRDQFGQRMEADDIADAISYIVTRPRQVAVNEVLIRPTEQVR